MSREKKITQLRYTIKPAMRIKHLILTIIVNAILIASSGQDSLNSLSQPPSKYYGKVSERLNALEQNLDKKSDKTLKQFQTQEQRLKLRISIIIPSVIH